MNDYLDRIRAAGVDGSAVLARGLMLLEILRKHSGVTVKELAALADLPLATTYRLIGQLQASGFATEFDGHIHASRVLTLADDSASPHLVEVMRPALLSVSRQTGLATVLTVRVNTLCLTLDSISPVGKPRPLFGIGDTRVIYAGASAKPLLAYAEPEVIAKVTNSARKKYTNATPTGQVLKDALKRIRVKGYDVSDGEIQAQTRGIGIPLLDNGIAYACLSVVSQISRMPPTDEVVEVLRAAAEFVALKRAHGNGPTWTSAETFEPGELHD